MAVRNQLPENEAVWRYLFTDATRESLSSTRTVLGDLLDGLAGASGGAGEYFKIMTGTWPSERESSKAFDWRYYLVKYPSMRKGATGIYHGVGGKLGGYRRFTSLRSSTSGRTSQPDGHHLSSFVAKMILVTCKSDVHPAAAARRLRPKCQRLLLGSD